ncbi:MAG TPA: PEP-CTERM sorting domain-containing protein [Opitutaceae bacterium]|nr:PEP-CTERM sorting domain-containing protein [Opitutaceae bacterium]
MKRLLLICALASLPFASNAQLWNGDPLPPAWTGTYVIDPYFVPTGPGAAGLSEFDMDSGFDFSLLEGGTKPIGITEANGWFNAANFAVELRSVLDVAEPDFAKVTFLGKTAAWSNDFGINLGGSNVSGDGAYTIWEGITNTSLSLGSQIEYIHMGESALPIDFWLNSDAAANGGTYSMFFPGTSDPSNTGLPLFDYSARGRIFSVNDSLSGMDRTILVIAIEDWREFDRDFTDWFFAIELSPLQPPAVPEPSTYGLIGAMVLLGFAAIRRARRS